MKNGQRFRSRGVRSSSALSENVCCASFSSDNFQQSTEARGLKILHMHIVLPSVVKITICINMLVFFFSLSLSFIHITITSFEVRRLNISDCICSCDHALCFKQQDLFVLLVDSGCLFGVVVILENEFQTNQMPP